VALSRWSLDRIYAWVGTAALLVLFVPSALYLTHSLSASVETALLERGGTLGRALAAQAVEPVLVEDRLALRDLLDRATAGHQEVRYISIQSDRGEVVAHTFGDGYPVALGELWRTRPGQTTRFRAEGESLVDIPVPVLEGQLGYLHVGVSRATAIRQGERVLWLMGLLLTAGLGVILAGSRFVAARVCRPLQQLEQAVSRFPQQRMDGTGLQRRGTREVESLARGFGAMVERLDALSQDRQATQERMIHAERLAALGELAAGLAHEIHNPLDGMLECLRYLQADPDKSQRAAKYYPMLREGLERIARTMHQMLGFARSGQRVCPQPCGVRDMMEALELLVRPRVKDRKVQLSWRSSGDCVCYCDPDGLVQAGMNLVLNALEAADGSPGAQVAVDVSCDNRWVYICVEDSGPGVPGGLRSKVFDAFFTTKPSGKGTGLGLSVSRQLIRAAGGELELSPEPSSFGGAKFVIRLPKVQNGEERDGGARPSADC